MVVWQNLTTLFGLYITNQTPHYRITIYTISIDRFNNKWIVTNSGGLVKLNDSTWTVYDTSNSGFS